MTGRHPTAESERRLEALRELAARQGRVDASGVRPVGAPFPRPDADRSYYGLPLLKQPTWTWEVPVYFFVGGAAGAAAVIAAGARLNGGGDRTVREGRYLAAAGAALSAPLLISDLGRPERFLNMLRVFKWQSAMSVGAWTLTAFSCAAGTAALAAIVSSIGTQDKESSLLRWAGDLAGLVAGLTGAIMTTYTGVLVGATAVPVWARNVKLLPIHFAASSVGSAVALLNLRGCSGRALTTLALSASAAESAIAFQIESDKGSGHLNQGSSGVAVRTAALLSGPIPFVLRLVGSRRARQIAALSSLAGSLLTRFAWLEAGKASAAGHDALERSR